MLRANSRLRIIRKKRERKANSYEKMMKTLLLQNQQIIIQQQNMMFMVIKQLQHPSQPNSSSSDQQSQPTQRNAQQQPQPQHHHQQHPQPQQHRNVHQDNTTQQIQSQHHHQVLQQDHAFNTHQLFSQASTISALDTHHQLQQQVESQLQESNYLTPAASEQDPINDKSEDDDLTAFLENDGLLQNNLLYHPQTDIGSITPYKSHQQQQETPSYYSSGCESLTTPRVEAQKQPSITNISQNVVKNLADSFKSPTKPKINVQILSGTATGSMKNSKAKIIQRMNISEFLRHVHPDTDELQKTATPL